MIKLEDLLQEPSTVLPDMALVQARETAIRYIRFSGSKSSGQVTDHLRSKGIPTDVVTRIVDDLRDDAWIDDTRLARRILAERQGRKIEGEAALRQRMLKRGIPSVVVDEVLHQRQADESEDVHTFFTERCRREIMQLQSGELTDDEAHSLTHKILRRAISRGFSTGVCFRVLREMGISVHEY